MSIQILCLFKIELLEFLLLGCKSSLYILDASPLPDMFANIFSHFVDCLFLIVSFEAQKYLILMKSNLFFSLVVYAFGVISKKALSNPRSQRFIPTFYCRSAIVLMLTFRSVIYIELILVYGVREPFT